MYKGHKIGISIPAYNEEKLIGKTLEEIPNYVDKIYVCDDCSIDKTSEIVKEFIKKDPRIELIRHSVNTGVGGAIIDCWKKGITDKMDILAVMAGDNQMDPKYLPDLLDPIVNDKADYTKGNRLNGSDYVLNMPKFRHFGNLILTYLTKISSGYWHIKDPQNGYTAISTDVLKVVDPESIYKWYGYLNDLLARLNVHNFRVMDVPIPAKYGEEKSKIKYSKYIFKVSLLLLKNYIWRLKTKYLNL